MNKFLGKVALITGASSGIGNGTAIEFAKNGCNLVLSGRNLENLQNTKHHCLINSNNLLKDENIIYVTGDVAKISDCKNIIEKTIQHFGRLDVLVNSAGTMSRGSIEEVSLDDFDKIMNVNTRSVFYLIQLAIPYLKKVKGNIVNVSSVNGLRAFPGLIAYNISKAAVDQLTRCTALELAPFNIRVNSVNPGVIITNLHSRSGMNEQDYKKFLDHSKTTHALGRPGNVVEVAKSILFLASSDASYITGVTLNVDGGRGQMCPR